MPVHHEPVNRSLCNPKTQLFHQNISIENKYDAFEIVKYYLLLNNGCTIKVVVFGIKIKETTKEMTLDSLQ